MKLSLTNRFLNTFRRQEAQVADPFLVTEFESQKREFEVRKQHLNQRIFEVETKEKSLNELIAELGTLQGRLNQSFQELATEKSYFERQFLVQRKQLQLSEARLQKHELDLLSQAYQLDQEEEELRFQAQQFHEQRYELKIETQRLEQQKLDLEARNQDLMTVQEGLARESEAIEQQHGQVTEELEKIAAAQMKLAAERAQLKQRTGDQQRKLLELESWETTLNMFAEEVAQKEESSKEKRAIFEADRLKVQSQLEIIEEQQQKLAACEVGINEKLEQITHREQQVRRDIEHNEQIVKLQAAQQAQFDAQQKSIDEAIQSLEVARLALEQDRKSFVTKQTAFLERRRLADSEHASLAASESELKPETEPFTPEDSPELSSVTQLTPEGEESCDEFESLAEDALNESRSSSPATMKEVDQEPSEGQPSSTTVEIKVATEHESVFNSDDEVQRYAEELMARYRSGPAPSIVPQKKPAADSIPKSFPEMPLDWPDDGVSKEEPSHRQKKSSSADFRALREVAVNSARVDIAKSNLKHERRNFRVVAVISGFGCLATTSVLVFAEELSSRSQSIVLTLGCISAIYTLKAFSHLMSMRKLNAASAGRSS
ncbi:coiled-coil domain-containing protein [Thalassoglobus polymorphus]|uniref:Uncharacterized protein n=1 Tax=Thalassoglobus polymorphus TaxID=2527994 RepID=A0A517QJK2_9PLAN|nr:hypothetical protein [Thalassoglobus polymorphus]QDT31823.1 hypothetical protein Mal48_10590 [Thalassoglobus polymorphus]